MRVIHDGRWKGTFVVSAVWNPKVRDFEQTQLIPARQFQRSASFNDPPFFTTRMFSVSFDFLTGSAPLKMRRMVSNGSGRIGLGVADDWGWQICISDHGTPWLTVLAARLTRHAEKPVHRAYRKIRRLRQFRKAGPQFRKAGPQLRKAGPQRPTLPSAITTPETPGGWIEQKTTVARPIPGWASL